MKKRVLHILNSSSYSGAENVVISIINKLSEKYECAYASREGEVRRFLEANNISFIPLKKMSIPEVNRIKKLYKPDLIHSHDFTASIISALSGSKTPVISHIHNNPPWIKTYHPYSLMYLLSSVKYRRILGVSSAIFNEYVFGENIKRKSIVVSNPVDLTIIQQKSKIGIEEDVPKYDVLFIGRLTPQKDIFRFLRLVRQLVAHSVDIKAAIIGDGELKEDCIEKIKMYGLERNITLTGFVENPYKILSKTKLLCMTSRWEGFGMVAIEALSLHIPVVATPVGGIPDLINNECGKLCNTDEEFIREIINLIQDDIYWKRKSDAAGLRARELSNMGQYIKTIEDIYRETLEQS